ncbi:GbNV_gp93-like [Fopius arisanus]|nr:GbNV_gp93-like [Fopius arisanus]
MEANVSGRWNCHVHKSSKCEMAIMNETLYHIVAVKETTSYAQKMYNTRTENDEFWEKLPDGMYFTPIAHSNLANDYEIFKMIVSIFHDLDSNFLSFNEFSSPSDFVHSHIITDGQKRLTLCNKHLLECVKRKQPQVKYTSPMWLKNVVKALFPKATDPKNIPTNTPPWALQILNINDTS